MTKHILEMSNPLPADLKVKDKLGLASIGLGDEVEWNGKDSYYKGVIVSMFMKDCGEEIRCVAQDDRGLLLIKNPSFGEKTND